MQLGPIHVVGTFVLILVLTAFLLYMFNMTSLRQDEPCTKIQPLNQGIVLLYALLVALATLVIIFLVLITAVKVSGVSVAKSFGFWYFGLIIFLVTAVILSIAHPIMVTRSDSAKECPQDVGKIIIVSILVAFVLSLLMASAAYMTATKRIGFSTAFV